MYCILGLAMIVGVTPNIDNSCVTYNLAHDIREFLSIQIPGLPFDIVKSGWNETLDMIEDPLMSMFCRKVLQSDYTKKLGLNPKSFDIFYDNNIFELNEVITAVSPINYLEFNRIFC
jgi:hypothetical protein